MNWEQHTEQQIYQIIGDVFMAHMLIKDQQERSVIDNLLILAAEANDTEVRARYLKSVSVLLRPYLGDRTIKINKPAAASSAPEPSAPPPRGRRPIPPLFDEDTSINIGTECRTMRLSLGISLHAVAQNAGCSNTVVRNLETGTLPKNIETINRIRKVLKLQPLSPQNQQHCQEDGDG